MIMQLDSEAGEKSETNSKMQRKKSTEWKERTVAKPEGVEGFGAG